MKMNNEVFNIKCKGKGFCVYILLITKATRNELYTSVSEIKKALQLDKRDKKQVINMLNQLYEHKLITLDKEIPSDNDIRGQIKILINDTPNNYTFLESNDVDLVFRQFLNYNEFKLYCLIKRFYNSNYKYAFPEFERIHDLTTFSSATISKSLELFHCLGIIEKKSNPKGKNNIYIPKDDVRNNILKSNMEDFRGEYALLLKLIGDKKQKEALGEGERFRKELEEQLKENNITTEMVVDEKKVRVNNCDEGQHKRAENDIKEEGEDDLLKYISKIIDESPKSPYLISSLNRLRKKYDDKVINVIVEQNYDYIMRILISKSIVFMDVNYKVNYVMKIIKVDLEQNFEVVQRKQEQQEREMQENEKNVELMQELDVGEYLKKIFDVDKFSEEITNKLCELQQQYPEQDIKEEAFKIRKAYRTKEELLQMLISINITLATQEGEQRELEMYFG
ncbi:MAG: hypothetical protein ACREV6_20525 [Clostridium sp.]|uniref:hypothetical protein n=1 Tax=Clostridium sp. TaxID=1506 RepID=UPI003D6CAA90